MEAGDFAGVRSSARGAESTRLLGSTATRGGCSIAGSVNGGITLRSGTDGPVGLHDLARFAGVLVMFEFVFVLVWPGAR